MLCTLQLYPEGVGNILHNIYMLHLWKKIRHRFVVMYMRGVSPVFYFLYVRSICVYVLHRKGVL